MKFVIVFAALLAVALGAAVDSPAHAETLRYENDNIGLDKYAYDVETSDGKKHSEEGILKNVGTDAEALSVSGVFSYVGDDGHTYLVHYTADENGFQAQGDHLPQLPEHSPPH